MKIWMAVTADDLELPIAEADSAANLAQLLGCTTGTIHAKRWKDEQRAKTPRKPQGVNAKYRIITVEVDE